MLACGCCDRTAGKPRLVYATREGAHVRRRLQHDPCGRKWWQVETLEGEEVASHVDR